MTESGKSRTKRRWTHHHQSTVCNVLPMRTYCI